jgi:uncharacterized protein YegJ (DUF2314 family)
VKFNLVTNQLFTDEGQLIKQLECPLKIDWNSLEKVSNAQGIRSCLHCDHLVIDTINYTDNELYELLQKDPGACIKVSLNQPNMSFILA